MVFYWVIFIGVLGQYAIDTAQAFLHGEKWKVEHCIDKGEEIHVFCLIVQEIDLIWGKTC